MKLTNYFFILFAVSISLNSTSCSDDDNYSAGDIVGTWLMTADKTRVTTNNGKATELVNKFLSQNDNETETVYIFNEDGTFIEKEGLSKPNRVTGTYRVKGNKINLHYGENDHEQEVVISSLSSNVLMLSSNIDLNN